ncbi:MAG: hypothetical protein JWM20_972 [Patescibacteria group bacterium]|nr:hypothetical protein [Patescibacteria group bacterium]
MNNESMKKYGAYLAGAIVVIAIIIIIVVAVKRPDTDDSLVLPSDTSTQTAADSADQTSATASASNAGTVSTSVEPQIHFVSQTANMSADASSSTKHGIFTLQFKVNAADHDLYISQSCHSDLTENGVSFSLLKDGASTTDGFGKQSCLLTAVSGAGFNASNRFVIPAYTAATFQISLAVHPTTNGSYKLRVDRVGYTTMDADGANSLSMNSATKAQMQTAAISL